MLSTPPCDHQNPDLSNGQLVQVRCKYMNKNLELVEDLDSKRSHLQIPGFSGMAVMQLRPSALFLATVNSYGPRATTTHSAQHPENKQPLCAEQCLLPCPCCLALLSENLSALISGP